MAPLRRLLARLFATLRFNRAEDELAREVSSHLALLADEFERQGLSPEAARLAARRAFGGIEQVKERHRDTRSLVWLGDAWRDVRYAARSFERNPGFSVLVVLMLAVGIGASTAIFSLVHVVLISPVPFERSDQLVRLVENVPWSATLALVMVNGG